MPNVYQMPLKERFERANQEFSEAFRRKAQQARTGVRPYSSVEFRNDLYGTADKYGLFAVALWAYCRMLLTNEDFAGERSRPSRGERSGVLASLRGSSGPPAWGPWITGAGASLGLVVLAAMAVILVTLLQTPTYEASAKVLVGGGCPEPSGASTYVSVSDGCVQPIPDPYELQEIAESMVPVIDGPRVAEETIRRSESKMSAGELLENLTVELEEGTVFIDLTYTDTDPARAKHVVNTVGQVAHDYARYRDFTATVWEPAKMPDAPASPHPVRNGLLTLVVGLAIIGVASLAIARRT